MGDCELRKRGYIRNRWPYRRRLSRRNMRSGMLVDVIVEGHREWFAQDPVTTFIGHAVVTHWRYSRGEMG